jgi:hypothetical protein
MTGEYFSAKSEAFSDFTWLTRIGHFKFDECVAPPRKDIIIRVKSDGLDGPVENASARISRSGTAPFFRQTHESGDTDPFSLLAGQYVLTVEAPGFQSVEQTVLVSRTSADTIVIHLQPEPLLAPPNISFASESCSVDHSAEPGETVTLNVSFRNLGRISTRDLRIALLSGDGLIVSEPPRSFGIVLPGETSAVRPFTFKVLPNNICGEPLSLHFFATDGRRRLGISHAVIQSGAERVVFNENFDESGADLPEGWTSTGVGAGQPWTKNPTRATSPPNAAFSPDVSQPGANELVSPPISITTGGAVLQFDNYYDLEATFLRNRFFDGSLVEIKIGSGIWEDIESAGGEFESGGYDGFIDACCQNPLAGHRGWSGTSGVDRPAAFVISRIKLPSRAAGQTIQLRWRMGTDLGTPREGQYIDDILISDGYSCACSAKKY